ncbi:MAG: hypothetical protein DRQ54_02000 [Gammaproteobacteria bacterium]|nr:MAG: hypothetical protein DRQ54_02000 [Gammaproteobacteria bacterium]
MSRVVAALLGLLVVSAAVAEHAEEWLLRMDQAAQTLTYEGDFVFLRGGQMRHMQALHLVNDSGTHVRIKAVDGPPIEIVAHGSQVSVAHGGQFQALPGSRDVLFSAVLPRRLWALRELYSVTLGGTERVADRPTQVVEVRPMDDFRFGFRLWAERDQGLLLKAVMINQQGEAVEQYSFSRVDFNPDVNGQFAAGIDEVISTSGAESERSSQEVEWKVTELPKGFVLRSVNRNAGEQRKPVDHLLFSDGLATISVFVEPLQDDSSSVSRTTNVGGVGAVTGMVANRQVTVMGEVPAETLNLILNSVKPVTPAVEKLGD